MREDLNDITVENINLLEFVLDGQTSLYYNQDNKLWFFEYVDLEEEGEEYTICFKTTDSLPLKVNKYILTKEEFSVYEEIVEEESKNNES
ncbi:MAG: hypothetical protein PF569_08240 [Candidatus Woesearchaeota archaeon]|jgi:hypothetical protein|nr:hypothetical protein [Candidatus Woesearchaeota archaeon]